MSVKFCPLFTFWTVGRIGVKEAQFMIHLGLTFRGSMGDLIAFPLALPIREAHHCFSNQAHLQGESSQELLLRAKANSDNDLGL